MVRRGIFIVLEGCDRGGKTTQCQMLLQELTRINIPAEVMSFPDRRTATGKIIDKYLRKEVELTDQAVHLLFSANRWELEPQIKKKLESGVCLIVDRYSYSGVAFSAAKENMDIEWCWNPEVGLPAPDAVFLLSLSEDVASQRGNFGEERYEQTDFQRKVKENYKYLMDSSWKDIDADKCVKTLHLEIMTLFREVYEKSLGTPLKTFSKLLRSNSTNES